MRTNEEAQIAYFQEKSLVVMKHIDKVARDNGIKYVLSDGSLLGAIRHNGYIPWDDDMDISLTRPEYVKLLKVLSINNTEDIFAQTYENQKYYFQNFCKVRNVDQNIREDYMAHFDIVHGIWVDVFPFDRPLEDEIMEKKRIKYINRWYKLWAFITPVVNRTENENRVKVMIKTVVRNTMIRSQKKSGFIVKMIRKYQRKVNDHITGSYYTAKGYQLSEKYWVSYTFPVNEQYTYKSKIVQNEVFENVSEHVFEDCNLYIPTSYDAVLSNLFGNYMEYPPVSAQTTSHHILDSKFMPYQF